MAMKCLNCGYEMSTAQEVQSTALHVAQGILSVIQPIAGAVAGTANSSLGKSKGVKCPNCGEYGRWTDCD